MPTSARWLIPDFNAQDILSVRDSLSLCAPAAQMLLHRGLADPAAARRFLTPSLEEFHDPTTMRDMPRALDRLRKAIACGERILIYGDYDVDGTASVVLLTKAIELAGGSATFHIPHRLQDGYGMRAEVVEHAAAEGVRLIVSVDTGIRAGEVVARANQLGIDVMITDHHLPEAELPPAFAVLNPNRPDCPYPEKNLCGAGVAFKLVQALLGSLEWPAEKLRRVTESFLKMVAIATVADVVPLTGENRVIVKHGLAGLGDVRNPGLRALLEVAGFSRANLPTARQVAFQIAPRLNAAGRMDTARAVVELFLTSDPQRAQVLAAQLHQQNAERQQVEAQVREACEQFAIDESAAALVYYGEDWHRGVLGIVASRLVERLHRPVFVLGRNAQDGLAQGSGRSIPAFHLLNALEAMPDLFVRFGGHEHAAGVTMECGRVEEFRARFQAYAAGRLTPEDFLPELAVDGVIDLREITDRSAAEVFSLAPFGHGNPPPLFVSLDVEVAGQPAPWNDKHLRVMLRQGTRSLALKAWNFAARLGELTAGTRVDVAFSLEEDPYSLARGYPGWAAVLRDVRASHAATKPLPLAAAP
ncbi:MAG TPA: single-stranded-DNA-specific exonuclease RecJ [Bryobacteraceae bacterium]|jgi:single-stranded-DNA-specific exonuclease|nr:single-stranded-DNA-specific exonuclease RecJ [Bryobacteraceae bacterium]